MVDEATQGASITLPSLGTRIETWKSYSIDSQFLIPSDGWSFVVGDDETGDELLRALDVGIRCTISVNGVRQSDGYIDDIEIHQSRGGGTELHVRGRDMLGAVVDGCIDPTTKFTVKQTLDQFLRAIFEPYGFTKFEEDNDANRNVLTGSKRGVKHGKASVSKRGKTSGGGPLKKVLQHQLKPYHNEGAFAFAARVTQRHGLWLWLAADGETLIVGQPDFAQDASYALTRRRSDSDNPHVGDDNTVLSGHMKLSAAEQPSCIVATGRGGGGEHDRAAMRVIAINGMIRADIAEIRKRYAASTAIVKVGAQSGIDLTVKRPSLSQAGRGVDRGAGGDVTSKIHVSVSAALGVQTPINMPVGVLLRDLLVKYPGAKVVSVNEDHPTKYTVPMAKALFLHDDESGTLEQLEHFALREMALRQRKVFEAHYTVQGHEAKDGGIWSVDTVVDVDDDVLGIHEPLYVLGRSFHKSRSGGTTTELHLIRRNTMVF